jgi:hypothetical protein
MGRKKLGIRNEELGIPTRPPVIATRCQAAIPNSYFLIPNSGGGGGS